VAGRAPWLVRRILRVGAGPSPSGGRAAGTTFARICPFGRDDEFNSFAPRAEAPGAIANGKRSVD